MFQLLMLLAFAYAQDNFIFRAMKILKFEEKGTRIFFKL